MKYFIDFEATQYTSEIISIGCVDENGREFYTLVQPRKIKVTKFITRLTGITTDDLRSAPTADEAFSAFFDWIESEKESEFYCYGRSDADFIAHTMRNVSSVSAKQALELIKESLCDYLDTVKKHFLIVRDISLKKVAEYYRKEKIEQKHNALEDALILKEIYYNLNNETVTECPFPEYQKPKDEKPKPKKTAKPSSMIAAEKDDIIILFPSYERAAEWVVKTLIYKNKFINDKTNTNVSKRIKKAVERKELYSGYKWYLHKMN